MLIHLGVEIVSLEDFAGGPDRLKLIRVVKYNTHHLGASLDPIDTVAIALASVVAGPTATAAIPPPVSLPLRSHGRVQVSTRQRDVDQRYWRCEDRDTEINKHTTTDNIHHVGADSFSRIFSVD